MIEDYVRLCKCPVNCCRSSAVEYDDLYDHLTRGPHSLGMKEAFAITDRERHRIQIAKLSSGRDRMSHWTLATYPASDFEGRRALNAGRDWLAGSSSSRRLYIDGPPGVGKTGLAYGLAREWIENPDASEIEFENVRALLEEQRARFSRGEPKAIEHLLDDPDKLIVLDDVGAERPTEFALDTIALIVEQLHAVNATLIVTTNYAPNELAKRLGHDDLVVGQRIVSRLVEDALRIRIDRPDQRVKKAPRE